jgi:hypothetical protein
MFEYDSAADTHFVLLMLFISLGMRKRFDQPRHWQAELQRGVLGINAPCKLARGGLKLL